MASRKAQAPATLEPVAIAFNPAELAPYHETATRELVGLDALEISTADEAALVAEHVRGVMRQRDAVEAMRKSVTAPLNEAKRRVDALFKPTLEVLDAIRSKCDRLLGAFRIREESARVAAMRQATVAAQRQDLDGLVTALATVNAPTAPTTGVSASLAWEATVVAPDLLLPQFTKIVPNEEAIAALCKDHPLDEAHPPSCPGVLFKIVASTRVKR